jgi:hypothetical protein
MRTKNELLRPLTFEPGAACFWIEPVNQCQAVAAEPVWFVCHDPCPAFVIVRTEDGRRKRRPRAEIYTSPEYAPGVSQPVRFETFLET